MSYDAPEYDLLAAFKERFGLADKPLADPDEAPDTKVLSSAEHIYNNAIDVSISMRGTKEAARAVHTLMRERAYSTAAWTAHELHPDPAVMGDEETVNFIFTVDLLNYSFWSADGAAGPYAVEYNGRWWTGYYSLVAALRRALDESVPITSSDFWLDENECTDDVLRQVFRSATSEEIPMFEERVRCLREGGRVLYEHYECSPLKLIRRARGSARRLVHELTGKGQPFATLWADTAVFPPGSDGEAVCFHKRAQILVGDLWACFRGEEGSPGHFEDIDAVTIFTDYRIPQMLCGFGVLEYSPPLVSRITRGEMLESGGAWEVEIRGCAVWAVELMRREIVSLDQQDRPEKMELTNGDPADETQGEDTEVKMNAVLIDYFLYDLCKEKERNGELEDYLAHHRTRSIWY